MKLKIKSKIHYFLYKSSYISIKMTLASFLLTVEVNKMFKCMALFILIAFVNMSAYSDTLSMALSHAYTNNPIINSKRAELRSLDENVSAASSQFFPSIEVMGSYSESIGWICFS